MEDKDDSQKNDYFSFARIGEGSKLFFDEKSEQLNLKFANSGLIPLSQTEFGDTVCIVEINLVNSIEYLKNMGLTLGTELQVISTTMKGSVVVNFDDKCLGLGFEMTNGILVRRFS